MDERRDRLDEPADDENRRWIMALLDKILDNLNRQFELEERNEYLGEILQQCPTWHPQVEHLRQQHRLLHGQLRGIRHRVRRNISGGVADCGIRRQLSDWMKAYDEHQKRERALLQEAFTLDTGVGE